MRKPSSPNRWAVPAIWSPIRSPAVPSNGGDVYTNQFAAATHLPSTRSAHASGDAAARLEPTPPTTHYDPVRSLIVSGTNRRTSKTVADLHCTSRSSGRLGSSGRVALAGLSER
jgi:hypothetical protein